MKYCLSVITACAFCMFLLMPVSRIYAQYISPNNSEGKTKTVEERRYDEYKSKQNTPATKPAAIVPAKTNSSTQPTQTTVKPGSNAVTLIYINGYGYEKIEPFREGLAAVMINFKYGFIDKSGKTVVPLMYDFAAEFKDGLASVSKDKKYGFVDKTGTEVIPPIYQETGFYFYEECVRMRLNGKWGVLDNKGNTIVPFNYEEIDYCQEGLIAVRLKYLWGFVDKTGKVAVDFKYDKVSAFNKGIAPVTCGYKCGYKWEFIDNTGAEIILPVTYTESDIMNGKVAAELINGRVRFQDGGVSRCYDKTGKELKE